VSKCVFCSREISKQRQRLNPKTWTKQDSLNRFPPTKGLSEITNFLGEEWIRHGSINHVFVSSMGRIFREEFIYKRLWPDGRTHLGRRRARFIVGGKLSPKGYARVNLDGKVYFVHRVIAEHFIPNPEQKPQINHIDGNKLNNAAANLEWVTNQENRDHAVRLNLIFSRNQKRVKQEAVF